jgi:hypothetical protein
MHNVSPLESVCSNESPGANMSPRLKTLENLAAAAGGAFAYEEGDFDLKGPAPVRAGKIAVMLLAATGFAAAFAHQMGWTSLVAGLGIGRAAA